ncbi:MAG: hypothetical protein HY064_15115 [Bacteroidetes bacterium]|nr:hypothetical protein [Bacteroidota bacterium]
MSAAQGITNTDKLNYLNIGLILLSVGVAYFIPFELFLFSYAILGPAHYLTEISWLHERNYFSKGKRDYIFLGVAGIILFMLIYVNPHINIFDKETNNHLTTAVVYIAFAASLAMVLLKKAIQRFIAFIFIAATASLTSSMSAILFFSVFLPTIIHVYLFTGLFMLYGALKGRSRSGYLSCLILFIVPVIFIYLTPPSFGISSYALQHYRMFQAVNIEAMKLFNIDVFHSYKPQVNAVYLSNTGLIVMRFIAFAYTYHYLNWFSKTSVIKWHNVPKKRLIVIGILWAASVGFYLYDYTIGFNVLFLLSFLHVFLEFPLNHTSFIGIFQETRSIFSGKPIATATVKKGTVKKKK